MEIQEIVNMYHNSFIQVKYLSLILAIVVMCIVPAVMIRIKWIHLVLSISFKYIGIILKGLCKFILNLCEFFWTLFGILFTIFVAVYVPILIVVVMILFCLLIFSESGSDW